MGSAQSISQSVDLSINKEAKTEDVKTTESVNNEDFSSSTSIKYHDPNRPKGGMPLVNYVCRKKKKSYDKCVSNWYNNDFLTGNGSSLNQEDVCGSKFELYRTCVLKGIKKEIWDKQNLPPPKEGSPLAEVANMADNHDDEDE
jgi:Uncharacterised protein family (UPF0203)